MKRFRKTTLILLLTFVTTLCGYFTVPSNGAFKMSYEPSEYYKKSIYYERLMEVELTGNYRTDIVRVARTQTDYHEGSRLSDLDGSNTSSKDNYTEYGYFYKYQAAWCGMFVSWCARQAGIPTSVIKTTGSANADAFGVKYYSRSSYTPQIGDIIVFDWSPRNNASPASKYGDHVGIVYDVDDTYVYTVSGNLSNKVREKAYKLTDTDIKGYGVYTDVPALETMKTEPSLDARIDLIPASVSSGLPEAAYPVTGSILAEPLASELAFEELPSYFGYSDELYHLGITLSDLVSGKNLNGVSSFEYEVSVSIHGPYPVYSVTTDPSTASDTDPSLAITEDEIPEYRAPGPKPGDDNPDKPGPSDKPGPGDKPKPGDDNSDKPGPGDKPKPGDDNSDKPGPADRSPEPTAVPTAEASAEPVTAFVTESVTEPVTAPVSEPLTVPVTDPSLEHFTVKSVDSLDYLLKFFLPGLYRIDISVTGDVELFRSLTIEIDVRNYGDINGDSVIDAADLTALARVVAKIDELRPGAFILADINRDGSVDAADLTRLARIVAKID